MVGDICLYRYNAPGKPVLNQKEDPIISMGLPPIRTCPQVIDSASRAEKRNTIRGSWRGII